MIIKDVISLIKYHEGFRSKPYDDATSKNAHAIIGKISIGWGFNLEDNGLPNDVAEYWIRNIVDYDELQLKKILSFYNDLDEVRRAALIDMSYNLGINGLLAFNKFMLLMELKEYKDAAKEALNSHWAKQVGHRALRISKMIETGEWPVD